MLRVQCPEAMICQDAIENPNLGWTSFDNFLEALLLLFQIITLWNWSTFMYQLQVLDTLTAPAFSRSNAFAPPKQTQHHHHQ